MEKKSKFKIGQLVVLLVAYGGGCGSYRTNKQSIVKVKEIYENDRTIKIDDGDGSAIVEHSQIRSLELPERLVAKKVYEYAQQIHRPLTIEMYKNKA